MGYEDRTKAELQDVLRERDLPVTGAKQELVDRLVEADAEDVDELTRAELQERLRARGLPVSGSKAELQARLTEDQDADDRPGEEDADAEPEVGEPPSDEDADTEDDTTTTDEDDIDTAATDGSRRRGPKPLQLARHAARQLEQLSGRRVDGVSGLERADEGWRITLELVEAARIPPSTDVLGTYEVVVDDDGDLQRYERLRRYIRGQAGEDQA